MARQPAYDPDLGPGFLPAVPHRGAGQRYVVRPEHREWTLAERAVLWPVLYRCDSERAYLRACRELCRLLDRVPVWEPGFHPTAADVSREAVALIERKTVTDALSGYPGRFSVCMENLHRMCRTGCRWTWAERVRFLRPWHRKAGNGQPRVDLASGLMIYLDRGVTADTPAAREYLAAFAANPNMAEIERFDGFDPFAPKFKAHTEVLVRGVLAADTRQAVQAVWSALIDRFDVRGFNV